MAESRLDFRRRHVDERPLPAYFGFSPRGAGVPSIVQQPRFSDLMRAHDQSGEAMGRDHLAASRHGHSISFSGGVEELVSEPVALYLLRGTSGSASGSTMLPTLRDSRLLAVEGPLNVSEHPLRCFWSECAPQIMYRG